MSDFIHSMLVLPNFHSRPRIVSQDGHLVFETGTYRNITFKASEGGYIILNGEDIRTIAETVSMRSC